MTTQREVGVCMHEYITRVTDPEIDPDRDCVTEVTRRTVSDVKGEATEAHERRVIAS